MKMRWWHTRKARRGAMQISNGISYDVHSLFTPDVEIAPRVSLNPSACGAPETRGVIFISPAKRERIRCGSPARFHPGMRIYPRLTTARFCFLRTSPRKFPWKYSPIRDYTVATSQIFIFFSFFFSSSAHRAQCKICADRTWGANVSFTINKCSALKLFRSKLFVLCRVI